MIIAATRYGSAGGASKLPAYNYTGLAPLEKKAETGDDWELVFTRPANAPSGPTTTITFTKDVDVEIFAVGGGQGGKQLNDGWCGSASNSYAFAGDGGNGGGTATASKKLIKGTAYSVTVGGSGMSTSFDDSQHTINVVAASGEGANGGYGARQGTDSERPALTQRDSTAGDPGVYAFNQQTTDGLLYSPSTKYGAGGGGGGAKNTTGILYRSPSAGGDTGGGAGGDVPSSNVAQPGSAGAANTGAGGGGGSVSATAVDGESFGAGGLGGSGIVIIRNVRSST